jgi:hypothetical protein
VEDGERPRLGVEAVRPEPAHGLGLLLLLLALHAREALDRQGCGRRDPGARGEEETAAARDGSGDSSAPPPPAGAGGGHGLGCVPPSITLLSLAKTA